MSSSSLSIYKCLQIFSGLPRFIECISGFDDFLFVGTREGHLLIYKIIFSPSSIAPEVTLIFSNKHFSRRPILQLDVIPEHKILISLTSDNGISVYDIGHFGCQFISSIENTKGATLFDLNIMRQISLSGDPAITVRCVVVVGKRLQLFYWKNRAFIELREDLFVPEIPKVISWSKETICIGFKNEYCLILLNHSGESKELFKTKIGEPIIAKISDTSFALVQDKNAILIGTEGASENAVQWNEVPTCLVYNEPYLIALFNGKGVEIRTISPKLLIESIELKEAKLLWSSGRGHAFIASNKTIWCLKAIPVEDQIELFLEQKQFELSFVVAKYWDELDDERKKKIKYIQKLYAFNLFCSKKFQEAMDIYSKLDLDIKYVIGHFPNLLPENTQIKLDYPGPLPNLVGVDLETGISALIVYLTETRNATKASLTMNSQLDGTESEKIVANAKKDLKIIDTILLKCYIQTKESLVVSLLRLENYCHLEESERALIQREKWNELILLYQTKNLHQKALELLQKHSDYQKIINYLQHLERKEIDLILKFALPILNSNPDDALKIFTIEDISEVEFFPRPKIYDFLSKNKASLAIPYLEHVINIWNDKNPLFHNAYIYQWKEKVIQTTISNEKLQFRSVLKNFLKKSKFYNPEVVLRYFPYDDLFEERALILERLGQHMQALIIYIGVLKDIKKALEYCTNVYDKNDSSKKEVFTILLSILLNPPTNFMPGVLLKSGEKDVGLAIKILHDYAPYIEYYGALSKLPDDVNVKEVQSFIKTSVQNHLSEKRRLLIQKGLVNSEFLRASNEKIKSESEKFLLTDYSTCAVCKRRFQETNAFARYPDGSIVHFSCQQHE